MGEPVKIVDLADTMIRLGQGGDGHRGRVRGSAAGEKLHEELWSKDETVTPSSHEAILLVTRPPIDAAWLEEELDALAHLVQDGETLELVGRLNMLVGASPRVRLRRRSGRRETAPASSVLAGAASPDRGRWRWLASLAFERVVLASREQRVWGRPPWRSERVRLDGHEIRAPGPNTDDTSTMPLDSQLPRFAAAAALDVVPDSLVEGLIHLRGGDPCRRSIRIRRVEVDAQPRRRLVRPSRERVLVD